MGGRNIGHVEFLVDFDGDHLPRQARQIGEKAGAQMGDGIDKGSEDSLSKFGTRLRKEMEGNGREAGTSFSDAFDRSINRNLDDTVNQVNDIFSREKGFDRYASNFDSVGEASDDLDRKLTRLHDTGRITDDQFLDMIDTQSEFTLRARRAADEVARQSSEFSDLSDELRQLDTTRLIRMAEEVERQKTAFGDLNDELRQLETGRIIRASELMDDLGKKSRGIAIARGEVEEFNRVFGDGNARQNIEAYARMFGGDLPAAFRHLDERMRSVRAQFPQFGEEIDRVRVQAASLHHELDIGTTRFERFSRSAERFGHRTAAGVVTAFGKIGESIRGLNVGLPELSHGFRQAVFYTGLFTALAPGIAVLGSVSGSGLTSLAVGAGALGIAVAAMIPGFKGMLDDVEKLPPKARDAARSLQEFADPLNEMQDVIQEGMFDGLSDEIDNLRTRTLPRVTAGMGKTAKTVNGIFDDMLDRLSSPRGIARIDKIFTGLQPTLKSLGTATLNLGGAFSGIFEAGLDSGEGFASFLEKTTGRFNAWVNDDRGRESLRQWFENLGKIAPGVGDLIGAAGQSIADLVTPEAITNMQAFLGTMTTAVPKVVGGLGGLVDAVDPLGLAAEAVDSIGDFFGRNAPGIERFGKSANDFAQNAGSQLGEVLGTIGDKIIEISPGILDNLDTAVTNVGKAINSPEGKSAISSLGDALSGAGTAVENLSTALSKSNAIQSALTAIGGAADTAAAGLDLFNAASDKLSGDDAGAEKNAEKFQNKLNQVDLIPDWLADPKQAAKNIKGGGIGGFFQVLGDAFLSGAGDSQASNRIAQSDAWMTFWTAASSGILRPADKVLEKYRKNANDIGKKYDKYTGEELSKGATGKDAKKGGEDAGKKINDNFSRGLESGLNGNGGAGSNVKVAQVGSGLVAKMTTGITDAFNKDTGVGNVVTGFIGRLFGNTDQEGKAQEKGAGLAEVFKVGVGTVGEKLGTLGGPIGSALLGIFGGKDGDARGEGEKTGGAFGEGVKSGADDKQNLMSTAAEGLIGAFAGAFATTNGVADKIAGFFDSIFGGGQGDEKARGAGDSSKSSFLGALGGPIGSAATDFFSKIFGGDAGKDQAGEAGQAAGSMYGTGVGLGLPTAGEKFDSLFGGDAGKTAAGSAGSAAGSAFAGAVPLGLAANSGGIDAAANGAATQLVTPFSGVPGRVQSALATTPGSVQGVMGQVTGQPGADNTVNPFFAVSGRIQSNIAGTPGAVGGVMGQVSGQRGADNTVTPFNSVTGRIKTNVAGTPGTVSGIMSQVSGQRGADNTVNPFSGTPGRVSGKVSGTPGTISGIFAGISDFGAAGRIVAAFQGVPGLVRSALSGLSSIVQTALSSARTALDIGAGALRGGIANLPKTATGGTFNGAQARIIGEAGPEAVVPLNRPLARVDPSVRALSAIAQGKAATNTGSGIGVYLADGAVRVEAPNANPVAVAAATVDRIVARAIG